MKFTTKAFNTVFGRHKVTKELAEKVSVAFNTKVTPRMLTGLLHYMLHTEYGTFEVGGLMCEIDSRLAHGQELWIETNLELKN